MRNINNLVQTLQENVNDIDHRCNEIDQFEMEIEETYNDSKQIFPQFDDRNWEKFEWNLHIDILQAKMYEQDDEWLKLQDTLKGIKRQFEIVSKDLMDKVEISVQEYDELQSKLSNIQLDLNKTNINLEKTKNISEKKIMFMESELLDLTQREEALR